jgi:hypothetical protein
VKAERHVDGNESIENLQQKSVKHIRHQHHEEEEVTIKGPNANTRPIEN